MASGVPIFQREKDSRAGMAEGVDDSPKDLIRSTGEGSILEVATFFNQSIFNQSKMENGKRRKVQDSLSQSIKRLSLISTPQCQKSR